MPADPLDSRLAALGDGDPLPLAPAAAVRARGDQRRARTRAAVGGGLAAVAVLTGSALAFGGGAVDSLRPAPYATPSPSATAPATLDTTLLLAPDDVAEALGSDRRWGMGTFPEAVQESVDSRRPCGDERSAVSATPDAQAATYSDEGSGEADALVVPYRDAEEAAAVLAGLRRDLERCATAVATSAPDSTGSATTSSRVLEQDPLVHEVVRQLSPEAQTTRWLYGTTTSGRYLVSVSFGGPHAAGDAATAAAQRLVDAAVEHVQAQTGTAPTPTPTPTATEPAAGQQSLAAALLTASEMPDQPRGWTRVNPPVVNDDPDVVFDHCTRGTPVPQQPGRTATVDLRDRSGVVVVLHLSEHASFDAATAALARLSDELNRCPELREDGESGTASSSYKVHTSGDLLSFTHTQREAEGEEGFSRTTVMGVVGRYVVATSVGAPKAGADPEQMVAFRAEQAALEKARDALLPPPHRDYPEETPPSHGGTSWAVYTHVEEGAESARAAKEEARLRTLGYTPMGGDMTCDQGAHEGLGLDKSKRWYSVAALFATEAQARRFVEIDARESGHDYHRVVRIKTYCMD